MRMRIFCFEKIVDKIACDILLINVLRITIMPNEFIYVLIWQFRLFAMSGMKNDLKESPIN